ncbi:hypothetical protein CTI12_AA115360 [Artemisia annua]|uniref:S-protein homolog n=1 Tax=Artemisia annua TaxID=35608 RepID=A0A2U1PTN3_ARTAN|nr:hypothetical protein CTI12_AA115360 [Artemisia annua]
MLKLIMKTLFVFLYAIVIIVPSSSSIRPDVNFHNPIATHKHYNISIKDAGLWALGFSCYSGKKYITSHLINPGNESVIEFHANKNDATTVSCDFYWSKKDMNIHVYDKSLKKQCGDGLVNTCNWIVTSDAFYLFDVSQQPSKFVRMHDW